jgi:glycogen phosphorylase
VRRRAVEQAERRGESARERQRLGRVLSPDALTIGFARRFATYKRANLILADIEKAGVHGERSQAAGAVRLRRQGASARRARQARAAADRGADARPQFADKFVFVEDYDINVGVLVQGVDVWLNNPRRPLEASGTSGQKVVLNGGLNLSVLDGWWAEAYDG